MLVFVFERWCVMFVLMFFLVLVMVMMRFERLRRGVEVIRDCLLKL